MKQLTIPLATITILALLIPVGVASQHQPNVPDQVRQAANAATTNKGATIRMQQLENALQRRIIMGEHVIAELEANTSENTSSLQETLLSMTALRDDIRANIDNNTVGVDTYIAARLHANDLTKAFRDEARPMLSDSARERVSQRANEDARRTLRDDKRRVTQAIKQYNAEQAVGLGLNVSQIARQSGLTKEEARSLAAKAADKNSVRKRAKTAQDQAQRQVNQGVERSEQAEQSLERRVGRAKNTRDEFFTSLRERVTDLTPDDVTPSIGSGQRKRGMNADTNTTQTNTDKQRAPTNTTRQGGQR